MIDRSQRNQTTSLDAAQAEIYSASVIDSEVQTCFLLLHAIWLHFQKWKHTLFRTYDQSDLL